MPADIIFEIGTEEIPARFIPSALERMKEDFSVLLNEQGISFKTAESYGTPRRLLLYVKDAAEKQAEKSVEVIGPAKAVAYDKDGAPTKAAIGFAKGQGIDVKELQLKKTDKGEYICALKKEGGRDTEGLLSELLPRFLLKIDFPKSMYWDDKKIRFARPIRWLTALYGNKPVKFEVANVKSSNMSKGHRFMSPGAFVVEDKESYLHQLESNYVIVEPAKRRKMIIEQIEQIAKEKGGSVLKDEELIDTVTFLVEYPAAICGDFDKKYLELPKDILINAMKEHQKYFSIIDKNEKLMPYFICIANTKAKDMDIVKKGNERVLRARLDDASFYFKEDRKKKLSDRTNDLKGVVFQEQLGTLYDKVQRDISLTASSTLSPIIDAKSLVHAEKAAYLCKSDLLTGVVGEFPKLQGIIGREYALLDGEKKEAADAIYEHYLPRFAGDDLPKTNAGMVLSIADKIDNICGCFAIGLIPTGSQDPYALRRQGLGILQILLSKKIHISLIGLIENALSLLKDKAKKIEDAKKDALDFIRQRMDNLLTSEGFRYDIVDAVLTAKFDDPYDCFLRIQALNKLKDEPYFEPLMISFKRVINIVPKDFKGAVDEKALKEPAEKELFKAYKALKDDVSPLIKAYKYEDALKKISGLKKEVDAFFDKVLVMDKDEGVKGNRLSLLKEIGLLFNIIADFSKIVTEKKII
ncbi:MAG: glycine--tRNA ligase subunit beta [Nitrospirota bacterium]